MGMIRKEVQEESAVKATSPTPALPSFTTTVATGAVPSKAAPVKEEKMTRADWDAKDFKITKGGVAHDAATIVAAMSAMKTEDEVKTLYSTLFAHILKTVTG